MFKKLIIFPILIMCFAACSDLEDYSNQAESQKFPNSVLENANITLTTKGFKEAVIYADTLFVFDKEDSTAAVNVKIDFYDENGEYRSTLTSESGLVRQKREMFSVWGNVIVQNDTTRLETNSLGWNPETRLITTEDFVKVTRGADIITGYGMEADSRLENIRILRDVKGELSDVPTSEDELDNLEGEQPETILP